MADKYLTLRDPEICCLLLNILLRWNGFPNTISAAVKESRGGALEAVALGYNEAPLAN